MMALILAALLATLITEWVFNEDSPIGERSGPKRPKEDDHGA